MLIKNPYNCDKFLEEITVYDHYYKSKVIRGGNLVNEGYYLLRRISRYVHHEYKSIGIRIIITNNNKTNIVYPRPIF